MNNFNINVFDQMWLSGDTEEIVLNYLQADKTPIDLTGATGKMQLRKKPSDDTPALTLTALVVAKKGQIIFTAIPTQTTALAPKARNIYFYDAEITHNGVVKTIGGGKITVHKDITR